MKTLLPFVLFLLLCSNRITAQPVNVKTRINAFQGPLDFKINPSLSGKDARFELQHSKLLKTSSTIELKSVMADNQKLDSILLEDWDSASGNWVVSGRRSYEYAANGYPSSMIMYGAINFPDQRWGEKEEYTYDANGNKTLDFGYSLDSTTSQWVNDVKDEYTYDVNGNLTLWVNYRSYPTATQWFGQKEEYVYDVKGKMTSSTVSVGDPLSNQWVFSSKVEYTYDTIANTTLSVYTHWTGQWVIFEKEESTYDVNEELTSTIDSLWDENTNLLWAVSKSEYTYDSNGKKTLMHHSYWDQNTLQWVNDVKSEFTYNDSGELTSNIDSYWDQSTSQWMSAKIEYSYDGYGNMKLVIYYGWDITSSQWIARIKDTYYYSEHLPTLNPDIPENHINVYPNPATEYIVFDLAKDSESAIVELFTLDGKRVLEQKLPANRQISVSYLRKGLYLYRINVSGTIYQGKLSVE